MKNVKALGGDAHNWFLRIANAKVDPAMSATLAGLRHRVRDWYNQYDYAQGVTSALPRHLLSAAEAASLRHLYGSSTKALEELRGAVLKLGLICPYCELVATQEVEHYAPQEHWPEYAVHQNNMLPTCATCNKFKIGFTGRETFREVIHFLYDTLPLSSWLDASVSIGNDSVPTWHYRLCLRDIETSTAARIAAHFARFRLLRRYREWSPQLLTEISHLRVMGDTGRRFSNVVDEFACSHGNNSWRTAALRACRASPPFLSWFERRPSRPPSAVLL